MRHVVGREDLAAGGRREHAAGLKRLGESRTTSTAPKGDFAQHVQPFPGVGSSPTVMRSAPAHRGRPRRTGGAPRGAGRWRPSRRARYPSAPRTGGVALGDDQRRHGSVEGTERSPRGRHHQRAPLLSRRLSPTRPRRPEEAGGFPSTPSAHRASPSESTASATQKAGMGCSSASIRPPSESN